MGPPGLGKKQLGGSGGGVLNIKPKRVVKPKFMMEDVQQDDQKQFFKPKEEEVVESLLDSDPSYQPNTYGVGGKGTAILPLGKIKINHTKQSGPKNMIDRIQKNLHDSRIERPSSS